MVIDKCFTCECGWVAFGVTREFAEESVEKFNRYYDALSPEKQMDYYGGKKSSIEHYERCIVCGGGFENFRPSKEGDCPPGVTLNPIIVDETEDETRSL